MQNLIPLALLLLAVAAAVRYLWKRRGQGGCPGCSGGCSGCGGEHKK